MRLSRFFLVVVLWGVGLALAAQSLPEQPFSFRWKAVDGAGGYRADVRWVGGELVLSRILGEANLSVTLPLVPGPYELRLTTLNRLGQDESSTPWTRIHVEAPTAPEVIDSDDQKLVWGQATTTVSVIRGWAVDGTVELRSPSGKVVPIGVQRNADRVTFDLPALAERGGWDLVVTNPPAKQTLVRGWRNLDYPRPTATLDRPTLPVSLNPQRLTLRGGWYSEEATAWLRPIDGGTAIPLSGTAVQTDRLNLDVPGGLSFGDYEVLVTNAADLPPVSAGQLRVLLADDGSRPVVRSVKGAHFSSLGGLVIEAADTWVVSDPVAHVIRRISPKGDQLVAGTGSPGFSEGGFFGSLAQLNTPRGLARDQAGNLFFADSGNHRIRRITPAGAISTFAGSGKPGDSDGSGESASFRDPRGLAFDQAGNLWVADTGNQTLRVLSPQGGVKTFNVAGLVSPEFVAVDLANQVYVSDPGAQKLWQIDPSGRRTVLVGPADPRGLVVDRSGGLLIADGAGHRVWRKPLLGPPSPWLGSGKEGGLDGVGLQAQLHEPGFVAVSAGQMVVADGGTLKQVFAPKEVLDSSTSFTSTFVDKGTLTFPQGVALGPNSVRYYLDGRKILKDDGVIREWANLGEGALDPVELIAGPEGSFYGADSQGSVFHVTALGQVSVLAQGLNHPDGLCLDSDGRLLVVERQAGRVVRVTQNGSVSPVVSGLDDPRAVAVDPAGNLFVSEETAVYWIRPNGTKVLYAGTESRTPTQRFVGPFRGLSRMVALGEGRLAVVDTSGNKILMVDGSETVDVLAGYQAGKPGYQDGALSTLSRPTGLTWDPSGFLVVADSMNQAIRKIEYNTTDPRVTGRTVRGYAPLVNKFEEREIRVDGDLKDWAGLTPFMTQGGDSGEIVAIYLAQDDQFVYLAWMTRDQTKPLGWGAIGTTYSLRVETRPASSNLQAGLNQQVFRLTVRSDLVGSVEVAGKTVELVRGSVAFGLECVEARLPRALLLDAISTTHPMVLTSWSNRSPGSLSRGWTYSP